MNASNAPPHLMIAFLALRWNGHKGCSSGAEGVGIFCPGDACRRNLSSPANGRMVCSHFVQGEAMANVTAIEWTDATWNSVTGCTKISAGCDHSYAERFSERFRDTPERIEQPMSWRKPRMIFFNSMSD